MKRGEIVYGRKGSDAVHPIVYLSGNDQDTFIGVMLTSSALHEDNLLMRKEHFEEKDKKGIRYEFQFKNTHLVKARLLKKLEWVPFRTIGHLTDEGIEFVESAIKNLNGKFWEQYLHE